MRHFSIKTALTFCFALALSAGHPSAQPLAAAGRSVRIETRRQEQTDGPALLGLLINGHQVLALPLGDSDEDDLQTRLSAAGAALSGAYRSGRGRLSVSADDYGGAALKLDDKLLLSLSAEEAAQEDESAVELVRRWREAIEDALALSDSGVALKTAASTKASGAKVSAAKESGKGKGKDKEKGKTKTGDKPAPKPVQKPDDKPAAPPAPRTTTGEPGRGAVQDVSFSPQPDPALERLLISTGHHVYEPPLETQFATTTPPAELVAQVSGPASEDAARIAVEWAIRAYAKVPVASRVSWRGLPLKPEDIAKLPKAKQKELKAGEQPPRAELPPLATAPGESKKIKLEYTIASTGQPDVEDVEVSIVNKKLKLPRESYTWFSNAPEGVKQPQLLYYADLPVGISGRLVFHHQNQGDQNLMFYARLVNEGSEVAAVHVIPGSCAPDINTYFVGYKSCENFWANLNSGVGYVLRIPPGSQATLCGQALPRGYTSSGYFKLTNIASQNVRIETVVLPSGHWPTETAYTRADLASSMVFPEPYLDDAKEFRTGDDWLYLRLGSNAPQSLDGSSVLAGMYGMTHSFTVDVTNTRAQQSTVYVLLRGSAGEVKGQFFINDMYVVTMLVKGGEEQILDELTLAPGESRRLKIVGIPLNGGFYPASIIIRETRNP